MDKRVIQFLLTVIVYTVCLPIFVIGSKYLAIHFEDYSSELLMLGRAFCIISTLTSLVLVFHTYSESLTDHSDDETD